ncbi:MAG: heme ABC transporter ATP-binding protein [Spirochaetes bacterium RBG_13_68_11]|nr:MAG: heme ABC transporter ATP-binding protein [Spirochaetes bacterium RBG_13_68_11]
MARIDTLEMRGITKRFGATVANRDVGLTVKAGEVIGLLGENGAGKTTLMNVLYGLYAADAGEIHVNGRPVRFSSPRDAIRAGIGMVHQHFMLVQKHTVAENVALADERAPFFFPAARVAGTLAEFFRRYGLTVDPARRVWQLSAGEQQKVEIVKALLQGADVLILDEPTSVLTPAEAAELFAVVRRMCAEGHSVIFISHKLEEVLSICTRIVVLRRGAVAGEADPRAVDRASLAGMMVGREVLFSLERGAVAPGEVVLEVEDLRVPGDRGREAVSGISFTVRQGEIFGIAGVSGNGQRELVEVVTGLRRSSRGAVRLSGRDITNVSARVACDLGISHVPEERIRFGVVPNLLVFENAVLKQHRSRLFSRSVFLDYRAMRGRAADIVASHQVSTPSLEVPVKHLSGGNIQKLILGRETADEHALLVASHPTYGLDVGATEYVRRQLLALRERSKAVLLVSEDLEEIFELADRIGVMYGGRLVGIVDRERADLEEIGLWMAGSARELFTAGEVAPGQGRPRAAEDRDVRKAAP